jgi:single-stranded DNA-binding protein
MPTIATACVIGHLYGQPELKENDRGKWCRIRFWTSDKVKGQDEKKFTSWGGMVSGPQAEWIARDGKKGTLVCVSGSIRLDKFAKADGTESYSIEFTRISECRVLDRNEDAPEQQRPKQPAAQTKPAAAQSDEEPPF